MNQTSDPAALRGDLAGHLASDLVDMVSRALAEDVGDGDLTAALIAADTDATAELRVREAAILCGTAWFNEVFRQLDSDVRMTWHGSDGDRLVADTVVCTLHGRARSILTGERTALNFLQTLSGTATAARHCVDAVEGTGTRILDTRKTLPGLRLAQKFAVRCGGATNHRVGLFDAVLIKENHIAMAGGLLEAVDSARQRYPRTMIEVEVENLDELQLALTSPADRIMVDNFTLPELRTAVALRNAAARHIPLEASGGFEPEHLRAVAETGVDYISIGGITKHVHAVDFSLRLS